MFLVDTLMFPKNNFVLRLFKDFKEERHSSSIFFFILSTKQASHFSHLWRSWELIGIWSIRLQHFVRIFWALTLLCHFVTIFLVCSCIRKCMSFLDSVSFNYHFSSTQLSKPPTTSRNSITFLLKPLSGVLIIITISTFHNGRFL